jgi:peptidoglycan/LPS O-acetylase OafA/YrhL
MADKEKGRLKGIDALRGIAAFVVLFYHYFTNYHKNYGHPFDSPYLLSYGHYGVNLFFMISGFVIFMTIERKKNGVSFAVSRFSRLFPTYWAAVSISFIVLLLNPLEGREVEFSQYLINLSLLQGFLYTKHIDHVYWTLTLEIAFYCWIGLSLLIFKKNIIREGLCIWVLITLIIQLFAIELSPPKSNAIVLHFIYLFAIGVCVYDLHQKNFSYASLSLFFISILTLMLTENQQTIFITLGLLASFILVIHKRIPLLELTALQIAGKISYALYLVHQNIGYVIISAMYTYFGHTSIVGAAAISLATITTVAIALALHKYVEQPSLTLLRTGFAKILPQKAYGS